MQEQLDMQSETVKANEQKAAKIGERVNNNNNITG